MDIIKKKFHSYAIVSGEIWMYPIDGAKKVVQFCKQNKIQVSGFEAFKLFGLGIQPDQEHSIYFKKNDWDGALDFLSKIEDTEYLYEVWYKGY